MWGVGQLRSGCPVRHYRERRKEEVVKDRKRACHEGNSGYCGMCQTPFFVSEPTCSMVWRG